MGAPTEYEARCWAALHEHRSVHAAATALGIQAQNLRNGCLNFMRKTGVPGPLPYVKARSPLVTTAHRAAERRIVELEEDLKARDRTIEVLEERIRALTDAARPWVAIHAKLDQLLARPIGPAMPTHRRIADGGVGGKRERKGRAA